MGTLSLVKEAQRRKKRLVQAALEVQVTERVEVFLGYNHEQQQQKRREPLRRELEWATIAREIALMNKPYSRQQWFWPSVWVRRMWLVASDDDEYDEWGYTKDGNWEKSNIHTTKRPNHENWMTHEMDTDQDRRYGYGYGTGKARERRIRTRVIWSFLFKAFDFLFHLSCYFFWYDIFMTFFLLSQFMIHVCHLLSFCFSFLFVYECDWWIMVSWICGMGLCMKLRVYFKWFFNSAGYFRTLNSRSNLEWLSFIMTS